MACTSINPHGVINDKIEFFVTSFELTQYAINQLPEWAQEYVPRLNRGERESTWTSPYVTHSDTFILGTSATPMKDVAAEGFDHELRLLGYIPTSLRISLRKFKDEKLYYRLNIRWKRPYCDSEETYDFAQQCAQLYTSLQKQFSWSLVVSEFITSRIGHTKRNRSIVFNFCSPRPRREGRRGNVILGPYGTLRLQKKQ